MSGATRGPTIEELTQELQRILASEGFGKSQRLRRFLEFVVGCLTRGEGDHIREYLIAMEVFQRKPSFDQRLDPIVRVEASRLRAKLSRYYENEGKDDPVVIELPRGSYVPVVRWRSAPETEPAQPGQPHTEEAAILELDAGPSPPTPRRKRALKWVAAGAALALIAGVATRLWFRQSDREVPEPVRVTWESGLAAYPALSPDGKLLAYSSDRGGQGNLSIWVQPLNGGDPTRLTRHPFDDREASFSPDSSEIVFRSEMDGGGIYAVSVIGGSEPRLIVKQGYRPRYSPDGALILYWTRDEDWGSGQIHVVPALGGAPRRLAAEFEDAHYPVWSPDGRHVLFCGTLSSKTGDTDDWWVIPMDGGPAVRTGAARSLTGSGRGRLSFPDLPNPAEWLDRGVMFSALHRDSENVYLAAITPGSWQITSPARQLTAGAGFNVHPAAAAGRVGFVGAKVSYGIWSLPVDTAAGKATGVATKLTFNAYDSHPSLSADGQWLTFVSQRGGRRSFWLKDLRTGTESVLAAMSKARNPIISADGSRVVYRIIEKPRQVLYMMATNGGDSAKVCADCGRPTDWSHDGRYILFEPGATVPPLSALEVATQNRFDAVKDAEGGIHSGRFSPDGRWVAFHVKYREKPPQLYVAPFRPGETALRQNLIELPRGHSPEWSPDGQLLYYLSERDGFRCIWAQPLQPQTKRPKGEPFPVHHFHSGQRSLLLNIPASRYEVGLSVARNKLVFAMDEVSGNIWLIQL